jgi:hypothetical protein
MLSNFFTGFFQPTVQKELQDTAHEAAQVLDPSVSSQLATVDNLSVPAQQGHDESPIVSTTPDTHAVIASSKIHHDNINIDNTAAGTRSDNSFGHFRSQTQRMRERYREKRNAIELQHSNEVLQLTTMYQTVVQSKKEMEGRLLLDLKKKDEQFDEICRRNVGYRGELNSLLHDLAGMPELLQSRELDIQNMNEQHRHDVRAVKRQLDESHQRMTQSNDEVQRLQTLLLATQMELNMLKLDHETLLDMAKYVVADFEVQLTKCLHLERVIESNIGEIANDSSTAMISKAMADKEVDDNVAEFTTVAKPMLKVAEQGIPMPNMAHNTCTDDDDDDDDHTAAITTTHQAETRTTSNEDGQLTTRSGDISEGNDADNYASQKWDEYPILSSPTTAVISSSIRDQNINIDTADVTIPVNLFENFSSQIKQLEGHYKEELEEIEQRNKNEIQQLTIMHHTCVQSKNELEDRLLSDLKKKDEPFVEICRRNEARRLKCYVLKREVARMQELLQSRELDINNLKEQHQNDLHSIKRQLDVLEQLSKQSKDEVERLQTALQATQMELTSLKQEHETLIGIAKYVASDSEDRRTECRHLRGVVNATNEKNHAIKA